MHYEDMKKLGLVSIDTSNKPGEQLLARLCANSSQGERYVHEYPCLRSIALALQGTPYSKHEQYQVRLTVWPNTCSYLIWLCATKGYVPRRLCAVEAMCRRGYVPQRLCAVEAMCRMKNAVQPNANSYLAMCHVRLCAQEGLCAQRAICHESNMLYNQKQDYKSKATRRRLCAA